MRLNGIVGAEIPYYKMMNKAMPGPAKDTKRKPKNGRLKGNRSGLFIHAIRIIREGEYLILKHPQNCLMKSYRNWHRKE